MTSSSRHRSLTIKADCKDEDYFWNLQIFRELFSKNFSDQPFLRTFVLVGVCYSLKADAKVVTFLKPASVSPKNFALFIKIFYKHLIISILRSKLF